MEGEIISVRVKPRSAENRILGFDGNGLLRVEIKAHAQNGKANKELIKLLSKHFKKRVEIVSGVKSRVKKISLK